MVCGGNRGFYPAGIVDFNDHPCTDYPFGVWGHFELASGLGKRAKKNIGGRQRERIVLSMIKRQLASIPVEAVKEDKTLVLKGTGKSMAFVSEIHLEPGSEIGMVYVKYQVEAAENGGEILSFSERNIITLVGMDIDTDDSDIPFIELLQGTDIGFEYLKKDKKEETLVWQEAWEAENDSGFPLAVRVTLTRHDDNVPVSVIARVVSGTN